MSILDYFRSRKNTANLAKERLQIIVSHQRRERCGPDYLPMLQKELIAVISKYVSIDPEQVRVDFTNDDNHSILELNIALPELNVALPELEAVVED
jgi:cell division topological specificity factor